MRKRFWRTTDQKYWIERDVWRNSCTHTYITHIHYTWHNSYYYSHVCGRVKIFLYSAISSEINFNSFFIIILSAFNPLSLAYCILYERRYFRIRNRVTFQVVYQIGWIRLALTGSWLLDLEMSGLVRAYASCAHSRNHCLQRIRKRRLVCEDSRVFQS